MYYGLLEILIRPKMTNDIVWILELLPGKENAFYFKSSVGSQSAGSFPPLPMTAQRSICRDISANIS